MYLRSVWQHFQFAEYSELLERRGRETQGNWEPAQKPLIMKPIFVVILIGPFGECDRNKTAS